MLNDHEAESARTLLDAFIGHRAMLVLIARRILRCPSLAEDVVQDAVVKVGGLADARCIACPLNFACRMVRNLAIDRERRRALECHHAAPAELAETVESPYPDPYTRLEACEALAVVMRAIAELPERTRRVFERHRLHDVPQKTIAAELGVSPTLVNFMVRDADEHCRASLRAAFGMTAAPVAARQPGAATARARAAAAHRRAGASPPRRSARPR